MSDRFKKASRALIVVTLAFCSFVFVFGLPWHSWGVWPENEMPAVAVHFSSAIAALGLTALVSLGDRRAIASVTSPAILALAGLGLSGLLLAPLLSDPWQSVYGTMKHGIGALWHVELAVLAASAMAVLPRGKKRTVLTVVTVSTCMMLATAVWPSVVGRAANFDEWLGLLAGLTAAALCLSSPRVLSCRTACAAVIFVAGYLVSDNRAVLLAGVAALVVYTAWPLTRNLWTPGRRAIAVISVALAGAVALWAAAPAIEAYRFAEASHTNPAKAVSDDPLDRISLHLGSLGTVWTRSYMVRIAVKELLQEPASILTGNGWGSFSAVSAEHRRDVPGRMQPVRMPGASNSYWDAHSKADFHTHNVTVEALLASGILGAFFWLAFLGAVAAGSRQGFVFATALAVGSTFWFPMVHLTAILAIAIALASAPGRPRFPGFVRDVAPLPGLALTVAATGAGVMASSLVSAMVLEREFNGVADARLSPGCAALSAPLLPEAEANIYLYRILVDRAFRAPDPGQYVFDHASNIVSLSCALRNRSESELHLPSMLESLNGRARLAVLGPVAYGFIAEDLISWGTDVDRVLAVAPGRTDLAVPYVEFLRKRNPERAMSVAESFVERLSDGDPVREYMLHVTMRESGIGKMADSHFRRAAAMGFLDLLPMPGVSLFKTDAGSR